MTSIICRSANVLIRQRGAGAALEAARRAGAMLERGDMDGGAVWKRTVATVEEIERTGRRDGEAAHEPARVPRARVRRAFPLPAAEVRYR